MTIIEDLENIDTYKEGKKIPPILPPQINHP